MSRLCRDQRKSASAASDKVLLSTREQVRIDVRGHDDRRVPHAGLNALHVETETPASFGLINQFA